MQRAPIVDADERRITMVLAHGAAVLVEAPAGFGKTRLLGLLAERLPTAVLVADHDTLDRVATDSATLPDGAAVLVDLPDPDPLALRRVADDDRVAMLVVAGRLIGRAVRDVLGRHPCLELGAADLALDDTDVAALLHDESSTSDPSIVDLVRTQTDGWPAAIVALAEHGRSRNTSVLHDPVVLRRGLGHHPVVDRLLRDTIAELPGELAHGLTRFGLLERFTLTAFDAVTEPGALARIVRAGVPVLEDADGWLRLPRLLRDHLGGDVTPDDAIEIASHLARSGGLVPAARALVASGAMRAAAALVLDAPRRTIDDAEPRSLLGVLDAVAAVERAAELGLIRARVHENLGEVVEARAAVDAVVAELSPDAPGWVTARLEQLRHAAMNNDIGTDADLILDLTSPEHQTRVREVLGIRAAQSPDPEQVETSIGLLEAAAGEWQALGDPTRAAGILRVMAASALMHLGRHPEAIDAAGRARRLATHRLYDRASSTVLILRLAALAGRPELVERERAAAETLAETAGLPWLEHHIAAGMAHAAALDERPDDTAEWARRAEHLLGGLRSHSTATVFHAEMATLLTLVGRHDDAQHHLAIAVDRRSDNPIEVMLAEVTVAARRGDLGTARRLVATLDADASMPETRRWRPRLELAIAEQDLPGIEAAKSAAQLVGLRDLADRLAAPADGTISIRVLGALEIRHGTERVPNPTGKPAELLKLLVLRGGSVTTDQAIDALWPDAPSTEVGLRRLKNPVNRLREAVGADAVVRSAVGVHLGPGVDTDLARFTSAAGRATGDGNGREASLAAVDALNLYEPLLPDEPPSELVANRGVDLVATASGLFDLVLGLPAEERPSSSWLLETARRVDLYAEPWFTAIARFALDEHNLVHARQAIALARAAAVELDLPENPELHVLAARMVPEEGHVNH